MFQVVHDEPLPHDIVLGRGAPNCKLPGNQWFLKVIASRKVEYMSTGRQAPKQQIVAQVALFLTQAGARLLRQLDMKEQEALGVAPDAKVWIVNEDEEAFITKIKQALRECPSSAKSSSKAKKEQQKARQKTTISDTPREENTSKLSEAPVAHAPPAGLVSGDTHPTPDDAGIAMAIAKRLIPDPPLHLDQQTMQSQLSNLVSYATSAAGTTMTTTERFPPLVSGEPAVQWQLPNLYPTPSSAMTTIASLPYGAPGQQPSYTDGSAGMTSSGELALASQLLNFYSTASATGTPMMTPSSNVLTTTCQQALPWHRPNLHSAMTAGTTGASPFLSGAAATPHCTAMSCHLPNAHPATSAAVAMASRPMVAAAAPPARPWQLPTTPSASGTVAGMPPTERLLPYPAVASTQLGMSLHHSTPFSATIAAEVAMTPTGQWIPCPPVASSQPALPWQVPNPYSSAPASYSGTVCHVNPFQQGLPQVPQPTLQPYPGALLPVTPNPLSIVSSATPYQDLVNTLAMSNWRAPALGQVGRSLLPGVMSNGGALPAMSTYFLPGDSMEDRWNRHCEALQFAQVAQVAPTAYAPPPPPPR